MVACIYEYTKNHWIVTLNGWIVWYVKDTSIKLILKITEVGEGVGQLSLSHSLCRLVYRSPHHALLPPTPKLSIWCRLAQLFPVRSSHPAHLLHLLYTCPTSETTRVVATVSRQSTDAKKKVRERDQWGVMAGNPAESEVTYSWFPARTHIYCTTMGKAAGLYFWKETVGPGLCEG